MRIQKFASSPVPTRSLAQLARHEVYKEWWNDTRRQGWIKVERLTAFINLLDANGA